MLKLTCPNCGPVTLLESDIERQLRQTMCDSYRCKECFSVLFYKTGTRAVKPTKG